MALCWPWGRPLYEWNSVGMPRCRAAPVASIHRENQSTIVAKDRVVHHVADATLTCIVVCHCLSICGWKEELQGMVAEFPYGIEVVTATLLHVVGEVRTVKCAGEFCHRQCLVVGRLAEV